MMSLVIPAMLPGCRRAGEPASSKNPASSVSADPPSTTLTDATAVFEKAFWKHPSSGDNTLHAERREWKDGNAVQKWQWFISVEPSPELLKYLRKDNAFQLSSVPSVSSIPSMPAGAPQWFTIDPADVEILQAPRTNLRLFFYKSKPLLLATDCGGGFQPGAPEMDPSVPGPQSAPAGRLPQTPPPNPSTP
jgi:hypothetical protein